MLAFLVQRVVAVTIQLFVAATVTFLLLQLVPGDPVWVMLGDNATEEAVEALRRELGLDQPVAVQYGQWLAGAARLDLGASLTTRRPVLDELMLRLPRTLELSLVALVIAVLVGIPIGLLSALHRGTLFDLALSASAVLGYSVPVFVVGFLMVLVFSLQLGWFPPSGYVAFADAPMMHLRQVAMPAIAISIGITAITIRMTRSATLEILNQDYVRTAHAKGLRRLRVLFVHVLRNAFIPILTVLGYYFGQTFGGSILTEQIFNWPGLSFLLINGIQQRDYPMVQGAVLVIVALFLVVNLLVDIAYGFLDPRIRQS